MYRLLTRQSTNIQRRASTVINSFSPALCHLHTRPLIHLGDTSAVGDYVDDIAIASSSRNTNTLNAILQSDVDKVLSWANEKKTCFIPYTARCEARCCELSSAEASRQRRLSDHINWNISLSYPRVFTLGWRSTHFQNVGIAVQRSAAECAAP